MTEPMRCTCHEPGGVHCHDLRQEIESLKAQLKLAHAFHDVAVKERDYERLAMKRFEEQYARDWEVCHDGSEQACCKSHED